MNTQTAPFTVVVQCCKPGHQWVGAVERSNVVDRLRRSSFDDSTKFRGPLVLVKVNFRSQYWNVTPSLKMTLWQKWEFCWTPQRSAWSIKFNTFFMNGAGSLAPSNVFDEA